jgi:hypothetical protein
MNLTASERRTGIRTVAEPINPLATAGAGNATRNGGLAAVMASAGLPVALLRRKRSRAH